MSRRIATILFSLFAILILSACAAQSPFQTAGSVTVLPEAGVSDRQINNRQQLAEYQVTLPAFVPVVAESNAAVKNRGLQINDRQQLAEYQANLPVYAGESATANTARYTGIQQINDRQELADYQATLR